MSSVFALRRGGAGDGEALGLGDCGGFHRSITLFVLGDTDLSGDFPTAASISPLSLTKFWTKPRP